ncbi:MAG: PilZ domain-containing protein [Treponema sp.]|nr:PilZ domain-containing protein [Treponema sp.]
MTERRQARRCKISQMIGYFPGREEYLWAEGIDLSSEGLRCVSDNPIDPLTNLFLMLELKVGETTKQVRCEGFVRHSRMEEGRCVFGVKIERISEDDRQHLEAYLKQIEEGGACLDDEPASEGPATD